MIALFIAGMLAGTAAIVFVYGGLVTLRHIVDRATDGRA